MYFRLFLFSILLLSLSSCFGDNSDSKNYLSSGTTSNTESEGESEQTDSSFTGDIEVFDENSFLPPYNDTGSSLPSENIKVAKPHIAKPLVLGTGSVQTKLYVVNNILLSQTRGDPAPHQVAKWSDDFRIIDKRGYYMLNKKVYYITKVNPIAEKINIKKIKRFPCIGGLQIEDSFYVYGKAYTKRKMQQEKVCNSIGLYDGSGTYISEFPKSGDLKYLEGVNLDEIKVVSPLSSESSNGDNQMSNQESTGATLESQVITTSSTSSGVTYIEDKNGIRLIETCTESGCEYFKAQFTMDEYLDEYDYSIVKKESTGSYTVYTVDPRMPNLVINNNTDPSCLDFGDSACINFITKDEEILYTNYVAGIDRAEKLPIGKDIGGLYKVTPTGAIFYNQVVEGTSCGQGGKKVFTYINFETLDTLYEENIDTKTCTLKAGYENSECSEVSCDWTDVKSQKFYKAPVKSATTDDLLNFNSTDIESAFFEYYNR